MRRGFGLGLAVGVLLSLATASSAWAQGAVLTLTPSTVAPGGAVTVAGFGFSNGQGGGDIRLSTRDAESLKSFAADSRGRFSEIVPIPPNTAPGTYLLIATQVVPSTGRQRGFTPGRAKLRVVAASSAGAAPGSSPGDGPPVAPIAALIALVLAASMTFTVRRLRTLNRTPLAR